jgi:hypothetical protein
MINQQKFFQNNKLDFNFFLLEKRPEKKVRNQTYVEKKYELIELPFV